MPFINVKMTEGASVAQKAKLIEGITRLMVDILDKAPEKTHVVIEEIPTDNWGVAGETVTSARKRAKNEKKKRKN